MQVVRPVAGVSEKLPRPATWSELSDLQLSQDGRCVAFTINDASLVALDVERSKVFMLADSAVGEAFGWIE